MISVKVYRLSFDLGVPRSPEYNQAIGRTQKIRTGNLSKEETERNTDDSAQPLDARDLQRHGWTLSGVDEEEWSGVGI